MNDIRFAIGTRVRSQDLPPGSEHTGTMLGEVVEHAGQFNVVLWEDGLVSEESGTDLTIVDDDGTERMWDARGEAWVPYVREPEA